MGLLNTKLAETSVTFAGIKDYAESGAEERLISAAVSVEGAEVDVRGRPALAMMVALGAGHMLGMLRQMPQYAGPFMEVVDGVATAILGEEPRPDFKVRDYVLTDSEVLAMSVVCLGAEAMSEAALNSGLPVVVPRLDGKVERETRLRLKRGRRGGLLWVSYKFALGSSNPLTTISAWSATVEHAVQGWPHEVVARPAAAGLAALVQAWREMGSPPGLPLQVATGLEQMVAEVVVQGSFDGTAPWPTELPG